MPNEELSAVYDSTVVPTGAHFDEWVGKLLSYHPDTFAYIEFADDTVVNLTSDFVTTIGTDGTPTDATKIGNFVIHLYTNGPTEITGIDNAVDPVIFNVTVKATTSDTTSYGLMYYLKAGDRYFEYDPSATSPAWVEVTDGIDTEGLIHYEKGDTPPQDTVNSVWVDTSTDPPSLKYYYGGQWVSMMETNAMLSTTYDPQGKNTSAYGYLNDLISDLNAGYGEFLKHKANELTLIHVTAEDRSLWESILSAEELSQVITQAAQDLSSDASDLFENELGVGAAEDSLDAVKLSYDTHLQGHVTDAKAAEWDSKADPNHQHLKDGKVTLDGSNVTTGYVNTHRLPPEILERLYEVASITDLGSSSITDEQRNNMYHNGNTFVQLDPGGDVKKNRWFKVIDQTKIGTPSYMEGLLEFTNDWDAPTTFPWSNVSNKPTTVEGYGITDLYTKTEMEAKYETVEDTITNAGDAFDDMFEESALALPQDGPITITNLAFQVRTGNADADSGMLQDSDVDFIALDADGVYYRSKADISNNEALGLRYVMTIENAFPKLIREIADPMFINTPDSTNPDVVFTPYGVYEDDTNIIVYGMSNTNGPAINIYNKSTKLWSYISNLVTNLSLTGGQTSYIKGLFRYKGTDYVIVNTNSTNDDAIYSITGQFESFTKITIAFAQSSSKTLKKLTYATNGDTLILAGFYGDSTQATLYDAEIILSTTNMSSWSTLYTGTMTQQNITTDPIVILDDNDLKVFFSYSSTDAPKMIASANILDTSTNPVTATTITCTENETDLPGFTGVQIVSAVLFNDKMYLSCENSDKTRFVFGYLNEANLDSLTSGSGLGAYTSLVAKNDCIYTFRFGINNITTELSIAMWNKNHNPHKPSPGEWHSDYSGANLIVKDTGNRVVVLCSTGAAGSGVFAIDDVALSVVYGGYTPTTTAEIKTGIDGWSVGAEYVIKVAPDTTGACTITSSNDIAKVTSSIIVYNDIEDADPENMSNEANQWIGDLNGTVLETTPDTGDESGSGTESGGEEAVNPGGGTIE